MWVSGLLIVLLGGCSPPYPSGDTEGSNEKYFRSMTYQVGERHIHYVEREGRGPSILFIHGTPGSWEAFRNYLSNDELAARARLLSVDRPGFGSSSDGGIVVRLSDQARLLSPLLSLTQENNPVLLVGHSLGAPVAARIALDHPDEVAGLLLIAPSLDPELEKPRWYNRLASWGWIQWILPDELQLANDEVMVLPGELKNLEPLWKTLNMPVTVIQGMSDKLVDPANSNYLVNYIGGGLKVERIQNAGHFILWKQPHYILDELHALLDMIENEDLGDKTTVAARQSKLL